MNFQNPKIQELKFQNPGVRQELKFQIVSDIHIEGLYSRGKTIRDVITPSAPFLIIAGDLGRVENGNLYRMVVKELCKAFKRVILVPGNHEYYSMNIPISSVGKIPEGPMTIPMTIQKANKFLRGLSSEPGMSNFIVLIDEMTEVSLGTPGETVAIYGSTFWSYAPHQHYMQARLYTESEEDACGSGPNRSKGPNGPEGGPPILVNGKMFNEMHLKSVKNLERDIHAKRCADENLKVLVVTHYAPSFRGTLAPKHTPNPLAHNMGCPKNYMYCSASDHLVDNSCIIAWVYGHTGHNGNVGKLVTNQMDRDTGRKDAVLSLP